MSRTIDVINVFTFFYSGYVFYVFNVLFLFSSERLLYSASEVIRHTCAIQIRLLLLLLYLCGERIRGHGFVVVLQCSTDVLSKSLWVCWRVVA